MRQRSTNAFTLVELLVVIAIIGMLMALLTNAVQSARESARRLSCSKNVGELAKAALQYESARKRFPGFRNPVTVQIQNPLATRLVMVSWVGVLTPYLDRQDIFNAFKTLPTLPPTAPPAFQKMLRVTICPSDPPDSTGPGSGWSSYTANGLVFRDPIGSQVTLQTGAAFDYFEVPFGAPVAAPLPIKIPLPGGNPAGGPFDPLSLEYVSTADGLPMTMMISENKRYDATDSSGGNDRLHNWWDCDIRTNPAVAAAGSTRGVPSTFVSITFGAPTGLGYTSGQNAADGKTPAVGYSAVMRDNIQSAHSGGAVVAFCDGHVGFFREDIGNPTLPVSLVTVYSALVTPDGGETLDESSIP